MTKPAGFGPPDYGIAGSHYLRCAGFCLSLKPSGRRCSHDSAGEGSQAAYELVRVLEEVLYEMASRSRASTQPAPVSARRT